MYTYMNICIYIYTHMCIFTYILLERERERATRICIFKYTFFESEREIERERERPVGGVDADGGGALDREALLGPRPCVHVQLRARDSVQGNQNLVYRNLLHGTIFISHIQRAVLLSETKFMDFKCLHMTSRSTVRHPSTHPRRTAKGEGGGHCSISYEKRIRIKAFWQCR